jgi:hypothetical protein
MHFIVFFFLETHPPQAVRGRCCFIRIYDKNQSQSINKVPTRFDVYIKGNRNDFFATRGADIAIVTGFGMDLLVIYY